FSWVPPAPKHLSPRAGRGRPREARRARGPFHDSERCGSSAALEKNLRSPVHRRGPLTPTLSPQAGRGSARITSHAHTFSPARFLAFSSAMPEIVSLDSGRSTGSLRSADRSAAL